MKQPSCCACHHILKTIYPHTEGNISFHNKNRPQGHGQWLSKEMLSYISHYNRTFREDHFAWIIERISLKATAKKQNKEQGNQQRVKANNRPFLTYKQLESRGLCITLRRPLVRNKETSILHRYRACVGLMMGKMHSEEGSAKLSFDESGDYILEHSFALQNVVA